MARGTSAPGNEGQSKVREVLAGWKWGVPLVVILAIFGLLAGLLIDRAIGAPTPASSKAAAPMVVTCGDGCDSSKVKGKRQGVRKFKNDRLDRQPKAVHYKPKVKRKVKRVLMKAYKAADAAGSVPTAARQQAVTKAYLWQRFKASDTCAYRAHEGTGTWAKWTCETRAPKINVQLTKNEIRGLVCWTGAGLMVPAVVLTGGVAATAWGLVGIGAGASLCTWTETLAEMGK